MITQELVKSLFEYKDGVLFWLFSNSPRIKIGDEAGKTARSDGYKRSQISGKKYLNHRIIYLMFNGFMPERVDHIDGDRSNNNISNLRECTNGQNMHNAKLHKTNTSGHKGVSRWKDKWQADIRVNNKTVYLGIYENIGDAIIAADKGRLKYHGEFANNGVT